LAQADPQQGAFLLNANAAGYGWFLDPTPLQDQEFAAGQALSSSPAVGQMDLLTAVLEEMGAAIGLKGSAFTAPLTASTRGVSALDAAFAQSGV
jgi:hypothetical protein